MADLSVIEKKNIEGVMMGLMRELEKLAPHPDHPENQGPLFVRVGSQYETPAEYEGLLGSVIMESFLGTAFADAASAQPGSWTQVFSSLEFSDTADVVGQYNEERYNIGQKKAISAQFNKNSIWQHMMGAYLRDLPKRLGIERWIAEYQRKLYALPKHAYIPAP